MLIINRPANISIRNERSQNGLRNVILFGALILTSTAFPKTSAIAATYYVDGSCATNGNGKSTTCGVNGPWKGIPNISCASLAAGDHVQIRGGIYYSTWQPATACSGAAGNPIVVENFANENV